MILEPIKHPPFPRSVESAIGPAAARALESWLIKVIEETLRMQLPVSALVARQKVTLLISERVSSRLTTEDPVLTRSMTGRVVWRVPVVFAHPQKGQAGQVGTLDVDAWYGEILFTDLGLTGFLEAANSFAQDQS